MERILVVDDEPDLCEILKFNLENNGYEVDTANSGEEALARDVASYNLFLLDVMMDDMSGFTLASCLRKIPQAANTPIIFITAKGDENDVLRGFNVGADDYIHKPFRISEVVARVKAVLRRREVGAAPVAQASELVVASLALNPETKRATIDGEDISLTKKEFEVLHMLLLKPGKVYSREEILARVWPDDVNVLERSIDVNMTRLRKKLGPYASHIVSRSGYGYCFISDRNE